MKQLTTTLNGKEILLVEVPEGGGKPIQIVGARDHVLSIFNYNVHQNASNFHYYLPSGNWKLLGLAIDIIEPVAAELVESKVLMCRVFKDYSASELTRDNGFTLAAGNVSLATFVRSHHFNPYTTVLLIKE